MVLATVRRYSFFPRRPQRFLGIHFFHDVHTSYWISILSMVSTQVTGYPFFPWCPQQLQGIQFQFQLKMTSLLSERPIRAPPRLSAVSQGCPRNSANVCQVEHRSFSTLEGGMSAASFLHSSFLRAISAVMLWPVHVEKVPQASEHLCPAELQTRCDICCACQSTCPFIPTDSRMPRSVDPQKSLYPKTVRGCVPVGADHFKLHLLQKVH